MNRVQKKFVIDAQRQYHSLTEWERKFVDDLMAQHMTYPHSELTTEQNRKLNEIQQKLISSPR